MGAIDIILTVLSFLYIILAIKNNLYCFVIAIFQCSIWAYHDFANMNLFFDGFLQIFYVIMAFYGLYTWQKRMDDTALPISFSSPQVHMVAIIGGGIISILAAYISASFFETQMPYLDATTTGFAIVATFLLIYRKADAWIYLAIVDLAYIYIYGKIGFYLLSGIMLVYTVLAIWGYFQWKKLYLDQHQVN